MTVSWLPVIWIDILGSITVLGLAGFCVTYSLRLLKKKKNQTFYQYLFLLTLSFIFFAVSRSFGHLVKQGLIFYNQEHAWKSISPFSGSINTATFIVIFSFGIYFHRSRKIHKELEQHKNHLAGMVAERTRKLTETNLQLNKEVTGHVRTTQKLTKTINEFSAVMDAIDYGVLFMDDQLKARMVNRAFRELWEITKDFVNKRPSFRELMQFNRSNNIYDVPDDEFEQYMDEREAEVRRGAIAPIEITRRDEKILQYQCVVLPDGWRMLTYFDITELKKTQNKLAQSQKMEAIGLMAGGVAHDLNNILSGVVSYPDLLLMQLPENSDMQKPLEVIKESGQRAAEVVADLLTVAQGIAAGREVRSLNNLIYEYLNSPEGTKMLSMYPDIEIKTDLTEDLFNISCSHVHIKKCLMNLLTNAAEAISGSGTIRIETRNQYVDKPVAENQFMEIGEYAVIRIADTGQGIDGEDISHIFEPFYTKKVMGRSGTGLGLAIVWNTIQDHGGAVTVCSDDQGTSFELYFPITKKSLSTRQGSIKLTHLQGQGEFILVVDDDQHLRMILSETLSTAGYEVKAVNSGDEALNVLRDETFDLMITDLMMPGIKGIDLIAKSKEQHPQMGAIVITAYGTIERAVEAMQKGA
ncbi:MAG: response regulator [Desulfobulbaceae bacterium]|nr:response regulator [Desulfobulbaceae bacterium]